VCVIQFNESKLHFGEEDTGILHVLYLKDIDNLLNLQVCPKCKIYVCQTQRNKQGPDGGKYMSQYRDHVAKCDGKRLEKELKVPRVETHFTLWMLYNVTYEYIRGHNIMNEWKPFPGIRLGDVGGSRR
jgi:hypothetical protein